MLCYYYMHSVITVYSVYGEINMMIDDDGQRACPSWHRNELARADSVLAYGYRDQRASVLAVGQRAGRWPARGEPMLTRDRHRGRTTGQCDNIMPPLRGIKHKTENNNLSAVASARKQRVIYFINI